ncbi:hypothetical protein Vqi01_18930 [Micromonospora qiuiae]|uniref:Uncharacterized protein n=1 Tax=Micromonospora qiuiae TaxID=502268 RepID=A0ABQ4J985_9ACTN|nr:hypothetical protein [Micromonospora qiuiae]GIJ26731.1 hypothetical protein Vqi01_18930 [Micromonospora qiuiae]
MALVDERDCSVVTVRHAMLLAAESIVPLMVVMMRRRTPPAVAMLATAGHAIPTNHIGALESIRFAHVAAVLAPSGLAWDFAILDSTEEPDALLAPAQRRSTWIIGVRHRHRWLPPPRTTPRRTHRIAGPPPLLIACEADR